MALTALFPAEVFPAGRQGPWGRTVLALCVESTPHTLSNKPGNESCTPRMLSNKPGRESCTPRSVSNKPGSESRSTCCCSVEPLRYDCKSKRECLGVTKQKQKARSSILLCPGSRPCHHHCHHLLKECNVFMYFYVLLCTSKI